MFLTEYIYDGFVPTKTIYPYGYIFLEIDNKIIKLRFSFDEIDILSAISNYVALANTHNFIVVSELDIKREYKIDKVVFPFVGKFKLQKHFKKTNNYFAPIKTEFFSFLLDLYNNPSEIKENIFTKLYDFYNTAQLTNDMHIIEVVRRLCKNIILQFDKMYDMNTNNMGSINLDFLKEIIEKVKIHSKAIIELELKDKVKNKVDFMLEDEKQKIKIK